ncbi:MAG: gamma-glutamyltransferase [Proteobacteria bacterium]|nr:gamma-glutamyltransferase [Pseudomonadota bacterium]
MGHYQGPLVLAACLLLLGACADREPGTFAPVEGFAGLVTGDEPRAVVIGREILGNGGTAVDAAVAMYFAMAVTLPSRVSLGGGGVCVLFQSDEKKGHSIEFMARAAPSGGMVPSGMRAMAALHARYGALRWETLLSPAESLARFGHAVSRSFEKDLAAAARIIAANPDLERVFTARSGRLARAGDRIVQIELSGVLSGIRQQGAAYLYSGPFARRLAEASSAVGMPLTAEDVRRSLPRVTDAVSVPAGNDVAFFAPPRATGGVVAAQMWRILTEVEPFEDAAPETRPHLFAEAALRAFAERARWMERDGSSREPLADLVAEERVERIMADYDAGRHTPASRFSPAPPVVSTQAYSAGFVIGDQWSNAVACSSQNDGSTSLTAVVVGNTHTGDVRFAGIAGEGSVAATALVRVMLETVGGGRALDEALAMARVHHGGAPDVLWHEPGVNGTALAALRRRGHDLRQVPALGHVNAFFCPKGLKDKPASCDVANDPRGFGLAYVAQ